MDMSLEVIPNQIMVLAMGIKKQNAVDNKMTIENYPEKKSEFNRTRT